MMDEEIRLVDLYRIILGRWKLLAVLVALPVLMAFVYLLAQKTMYTSTAVVFVSDKKVDLTMGNVGADANARMQMPNTSVATYQTMIQLPSIIHEVIQKAGLSTPPWNMTVESLRRRIRISSPANSSLITISVSLPDREKAALTANLFAETLIASQKKASDTMPASDAGFDNYNGIKIALQEVEAKLAELSAKPGNLMQLETLRDALLKQLNEYQAKLQSLGTEIQAAKINMEAKVSALAKTDQYLTTAQSITQNQALLSAAQGASGKSLAELTGLSMASQEINPVWLDLSKEVSVLKTSIDFDTGCRLLYQRTIPELESRLQSLQTSINAEKKNVRDLERTKDTLTTKYNIAVTNYMAAYMDTTSLPPVSVVQSAIPATENDPTGRAKKLLTIFIASFFMGLLIVFFVNFAQRERETRPGA